MAKATRLGARGLSACSKKAVLASSDEAFSKSQSGLAEARTILPRARRALDNELTRLYQQLVAL